MSGSEELVIRQLAASELDLVEPLWKGLHEHHARITPVLGHAVAREPQESWRRRKAKYQRWIAEPDTFVLVAERQQRQVGYAFVTVGPGFASWGSGERIAELQTLAVAPDERGKGIGGALLDAVEQRLESIGVGDVAVTSAATNIDSHRFYERRGLKRAFLVFFGPTGNAGHRSK